MNREYRPPRGAVYALCVVIGLLVAALVIVGVAGGDDSQTCPNGQTLAWTKVGGDTFKQGKPLPEGTSVTDSVSGTGLDYTVRSTDQGAELTVHGRGTTTFAVGCE